MMGFKWTGKFVAFLPADRNHADDVELSEEFERPIDADAVYAPAGGDDIADSERPRCFLQFVKNLTAWHREAVAPGGKEFLDGVHVATIHVIATNLQ